ncbi:MAG: hypothetical protein IPO86_10190 [Saprospiraceae bacterium]|nr:hypothetical protein [Saprospiraceae bacterium]
MGIFDSIKKVLGITKDKEEPIRSYPYSEISAEDKFEAMANENRDNQVDISFTDKAKEFVSGTLDEVKEQGSALWSEVKDKAADLDEATKEYREKIAQKAKDTLESFDQFVDETVEKAKGLTDEDHKMDADKDGFADKPIDFGSETNLKNESFFNKAEKWLEKNNKESKTQDIEESNEGQKVIHPLELPQEPESK